MLKLFLCEVNIYEVYEISSIETRLKKMSAGEVEESMVLLNFSIYGKKEHVVYINE